MLTNTSNRLVVFKFIKFNVSQSGTSMIEVLVSLFILSVGMFGIASLQFQEIRQIKQNYQEAVAASELWQISELMDVARLYAGTGIKSLPGNNNTIDCQQNHCDYANFLGSSLGSLQSEHQWVLPDHKLIMQLNLTSYAASSQWRSGHGVAKQNACKLIGQSARFESGCFGIEVSHSGYSN